APGLVDTGNELLGERTVGDVSNVLDGLASLRLDRANRFIRCAQVIQSEPISSIGEDFRDSSSDSLRRPRHRRGPLVLGQIASSAAALSRFRVERSFAGPYDSRRRRW